MSAVQALLLLATEANPAALCATSDGGREIVAPVAHDAVLGAFLCFANLRKIEYPGRGAFLATVDGLIDNFTALNPHAAAASLVTFPERGVFANFAVSGAGFFRAGTIVLGVTAPDTTVVVVSIDVASTFAVSAAARKIAGTPGTPIADIAVNGAGFCTAVGVQLMNCRACNTALKWQGRDMPLADLGASAAGVRAFGPTVPVADGAINRAVPNVAIQKLLQCRADVTTVFWVGDDSSGAKHGTLAASSGAVRKG